jgi:hypothetical protein
MPDLYPICFEILTSFSHTETLNQDTERIRSVFTKIVGFVFLIQRHSIKIQNALGQFLPKLSVFTFYYLGITISR